MDSKEIIKVIENKFDDTKNAIENQVERIVGEKHFHVEILWGIVISSLIAVMIGSAVALYLWKDEAKSMVSSQIELLEEKIDNLK